MPHFFRYPFIVCGELQLGHIYIVVSLFGDYFDHVLSWWEYRNDENMLFLKYEDMKKDIISSIIQIASFMNRELSEKEIELVAKKNHLFHP